MIPTKYNRLGQFLLSKLIKPKSENKCSVQRNNMAHLNFVIIILL